MLEIVNISKRYRKPPVEALHNVSFKVNGGEVCGLLGPNGAGKTTLVKIIAGLLLPSNGTVRLDKFDVLRERYAALRRLGVTLEGARNLYWCLSLRDNLFYFGQIKGVAPSVIRKRLPQVLESMQLEDLVNRPVGTLSSGQKQRAALAVALIHAPALLILDEPTAGLDVASVDALINVLHRLRCEQGVVMLVASHDLAFVQALADIVVFINQGHIVGIRSANDLEAIAEGECYRLNLIEHPDLQAKVQAILPEAGLQFEAETHSVTVVIPHSETLSSYLARLSAGGITVRSADRLNGDLATVYRHLLLKKE